MSTVGFQTGKDAGHHIKPSQQLKGRSLMIINTNIGSSTAARILSNNTSELQKSLRRLSTGSKIASISDDAAGVAVAGKMSAELKRIEASKGNVSNLISFAQTQDGYLEQIGGALNRMSELAMLATDATKSSADRTVYQDEFSALSSFIVGFQSKEFNGISLFNGIDSAAYVGIQGDGTAISVAAAGVGLTTGAAFLSGLTLGSVAAAANGLDKVQAAIDDLTSLRSSVGKNLSRMEQEARSLSLLRDNLSQARSRIIDVDVAEESANFARQQILVQSGTAMLAQANVLPQSALRLIS
jgi:flagellin